MGNRYHVEEMGKQRVRQAQRFIVHGRVQGVGFRWFAEQAASVAGVSGWVRNRDDGTVEAVAAGSKEQLDEFAGYLRKGPRFAVVRRVEVTECPRLAASGFSIKY